MAKLHENMKSYDKAIENYNSVANVYRIEKWPVLLKSVLIYMLEAARKGNQSKVLVSTLLEILSSQLKPDLDDEVSSLLTELFQIIYHVTPDSLKQTVTIDANQTPTFLDSFGQIYQNQVIVSEPIRFQLSIHPAFRISPHIVFTPARIYVEFSNSKHNFTILHDPSATQIIENINPLEIENSTRVAFCKLGSGQRKSIPNTDNPKESQSSMNYFANLSILSDMALVYEASFISDSPEEISMKRITIIFESQIWSIGLIFPKENLSRHFDQQRWFSLSSSGHDFLHLERHLPPTNIR